MWGNLRIGKNISEAKELLFEPDVMVYESAQITIGIFYFAGLGGLQQDYTEAVKWIEKAEKTGNQTAQVTLANFRAEIDEEARKQKAKRDFEQMLRKREQQAKRDYEYILQKVSPTEARKELGRLGLEYSRDAFMRSAKNGDRVAVELYFQVGMGINDMQKIGSYKCISPLMAATIGEQSAMVAYLLEYGADVNAAATCGGPVRGETTALIIAAARSNVEIAKLLIDWGADLNKKDFSGISPLRVAQLTQHDEMITLLTQAGATQ